MLLNMLLDALLRISLATMALALVSSAASARSNESGPVVHLFEWRWDDIARECQTVLGPFGFSGVQVSPPNEHAILHEGSHRYPWYQRYQPVSYELVSRSGDRAAFSAMVRACRQAGVAVYVDAILNHMTGIAGQRTGQGSAGHSYRLYSYPDYSFSDFHHCGRNGDDSIRDYNDPWEVRNCELFNLADLDTSSARVRTVLARYIADLFSLGVNAFRIDAAKHVLPEDLIAIFRAAGAGRIRPQIYQEVIHYGGSDPIRPQDYFALGRVTEFRYAGDLNRIFIEGKLDWLNNNRPFGEEWGFVPPQKAVVFIDNHDTQRGHVGDGRVVTHRNRDVYALANVFMLAWPYGRPLVMSSFPFQSPDQGPPSDHEGRTQPVHQGGGKTTCGSTWVCEHRWPEIRAMAKFRSLTSNDEPILHWWSNGQNQIAFARGQKGFVAINRESRPLEADLTTGLPPGRYCNLIPMDSMKNRRGRTANGTSRRACPGGWLEVNSAGHVRLRLPPMRAVAIHVDIPYT